MPQDEHMEPGLTRSGLPDHQRRVLEARDVAINPDAGVDKRVEAVGKVADVLNLAVEEGAVEAVEQYSQILTGLLRDPEKKVAIEAASELLRPWRAENLDSSLNNMVGFLMNGNAHRIETDGYQGLYYREVQMEELSEVGFAVLTQVIGRFHPYIGLRTLEFSMTPEEGSEEQPILTPRKRQLAEALLDRFADPEVVPSDEELGVWLKPMERLSRDFRALDPVRSMAVINFFERLAELVPMELVERATLAVAKYYSKSENKWVQDAADEILLRRDFRNSR